MMNEPSLLELPLAMLRLDGGTQMRTGTDPDFLKHYYELVMQAKKDAVLNDGVFQHPMEPITAYFDKENYWLADGFTRRAAYQKANVPTISANIYIGSDRDARIYAAGQGSRHGQPLTNSGRIRAVRILLEDPEFKTKSNRYIASYTGTTHPTVANIRAEIESGIEPVKRKKNVKQNFESTPAREQLLNQLRAVSPDLWAALESGSISESAAKLELLRRRTAGNGDALLSIEEMHKAVKEEFPAPSPPPIKESFESFLESVPIWEVANKNEGNPVVIKRLRQDIESYYKLSEDGLFDAMAHYASYLNARVDNLTPLQREFERLRTFPSPKEWQICEKCRFNGCEICGGSGYARVGIPAKIE